MLTMHRYMMCLFYITLLCACGQGDGDERPPIPPLDTPGKMELPKYDENDEATIVVLVSRDMAVIDTAEKLLKEAGVRMGAIGFSGKSGWSIAVIPAHADAAVSILQKNDVTRSSVGVTVRKHAKR